MGRARKQKHGPPPSERDFPNWPRQGATSWKRHQEDAEREVARLKRRKV